MTTTPLSLVNSLDLMQQRLVNSLDLLQRRLDHIEQTLARIQRRLKTLPVPAPVQFPKPAINQEKDAHKYYCSFCGKRQDEVAKLIAGPTVFICDECVALCMLVIEEEIKQ